MRLPNELLDCVAFLGVEMRTSSGREIVYAGTGFVVVVRSERNPERGYTYLVTAKHCVEPVLKQYGKLYVRLNTRGGAAKPVEASSSWVFGTGTSDVAVLPFVAPLDQWDYRPIPGEMLATDELISEYGIGIGDEVVITGLFDSSRGRHRNRPILRGGMIAAMPDEPLHNSDGTEYRAYLVEARSIGGLSGSPAFVVIPPLRIVGIGTRPTGTIDNLTVRTFLIGLIRGHWRYDNPSRIPSAWEDDATYINKGIAMVTPSQDVWRVLNGDVLMRLRKQLDDYHAALDAPTLDSAFSKVTSSDRVDDSSDGVPFTKNDFLDALKRVSRKQSDEEKSET